jgi:Ala-tRNA(Pro) deacylase
MITPEEQPVLEVLDRLGIAYARHEHPPVFTVEQAEEHWAAIDAAHCKNLFLRNQKGTRHYLVIVAKDKRVELKALSAWLNEDRLSFASAERLMKYLGLTAGSVSPFGLINDRGRVVTVVLDADLARSERIAFHPNTNTVTIALAFEDFRRFLDSTGHDVRYLPA